MTPEAAVLEGLSPVRCGDLNCLQCAASIRERLSLPRGVSAVEPKPHCYVCGQDADRVLQGQKSLIPVCRSCHERLKGWFR